MKESEHAAWVRHFDAIGDELLRLAHICEVPLRQPGVVEKVIKNDESVCGKKNPIGFRKLRELVMATFTSTDKALERIGPDEMKLIVDALFERVDRRMEVAGSAKKTRPPTSDKSK